MNESDREFQQSLILQPSMGSAGMAAPSSAVSDAPAPVRTQRVARPRRITPGLYEKFLATFAQLAALGVAIGLWWIGGQFTLAFLASLGINLAPLGIAAWLIPAGITAIEVIFWPERGMNRNLLYLFLMVAGIDLLTSALGGRNWLAQRTVMGYTFPPASEWRLLWGVVIAVASICAFWPEKLARAAVTELQRLWDL